MRFLATFTTWVATEQAGMEDAVAEPRSFLVEASSRKKAVKYARRFEGVETAAHEGLKKLVVVCPITACDNTPLTPLAIYEPFLTN